MDSFARDVVAGLSANPKHLSSKYFYDAQGDALFQAIMQLPEYYLTRCEHQVLSRYTADFLGGQRKDQHFYLTELGAGDGLKTRILLRYLLEEGYAFTYAPIDISANALALLGQALRREWPQLDILPVEADYFTALQSAAFQKEVPKLVLFLGSNIGNYLHDEALQFYRALQEVLNPGDRVLTGFDLKKNPHRILAAYNDAQGVTRDFNLNLLRRINTTFEGDFDLAHFTHFPVYEPDSGLAKSFLVSERATTVELKKLDFRVHFDAGECIFTEVSRKFSAADIAALASATGFGEVLSRLDDQHYFADVLWERI